MGEVVELLINKPETIALQFADGKRGTSPKSGHDYVMYTLTDGRKLFVKPYEAAKIDALNVGKGEPFMIQKREVRNGSKRTMSFEASLLAPVSETRPTAPPVADTTQRSGNHAAGQVNNETATCQTPSQSSTAQASNLDLALRYAIDAAAAAEQYAKTIDYALRFTSEDIRAMALSKFIAMDRNGGGKWNN
jgi:hypothetical protein